MLVANAKNPDYGVHGPTALIERHYKQGGVWWGNTELPVSQLLYALAIANRSQVIVETGMNNMAGASPWLIMAATINGGWYHGVDIRPESIDKCRDAVDRLFEEPRATLTLGDAVGLLPLLFQPESIDFLFVDDDHTYAHVKKEIEAFWPLMKTGGLMLFHDIVGVHEADIWPQLEKLGGIKLVNHAHRPDKPFGGLGMVVKR